jgi:hypothetical protein
LERAREKRSQHAEAEISRKRFRDALITKQWYDASRGNPRVLPKVQAHFTRCVDACLGNDCVKSYLDEGRPGWHEQSLKESPIVRVEFEHAFVLGQLGESLCV